MTEEIFGPILPVVEFDDENALIETINGFPKCLSMYYFGNTKSDLYFKLKKRTSSGALVTNDIFSSYLAYTAGFGGVGMSGLGKIKGY